MTYYPASVYSAADTGKIRNKRLPNQSAERYRYGGGGQPLILDLGDITCFRKISKRDY